MSRYKTEPIITIGNKMYSHSDFFKKKSQQKEQSKGDYGLEQVNQKIIKLHKREKRKLKILKILKCNKFQCTLVNSPSRRKQIANG